MYSSIKQTILSYIPFLSDKELKVIEKNFSYRELKKGEYFLTAGDIVTEVAYINKGLFRNFIRHEDGSEKNTNFSFEGAFSCDRRSYHLRTPSEESIQALEDSQILVITVEQIEEIYRKYRVFERASRLITQLYRIKQSMRIRWFIEKNAEKRYDTFVENYPELINRVPQYMIASYLGITPESLSRLIAKNKKKA